MKLLKDILYKVEIQSVLGSTDININKIEFNSKNIVKNDLFVAIRGFEFDGNSFISNAISGGAKAIICNAQPSKIIKGVTYIIVNDSRKTLALISSNYYDNPSKKIKLIGITGTNGKTSSSSLMYQLFKSFDKKAGLISTNVILVNDNKFSTNQTTPDSLFINYILSEMVVSKVEYCFMEVSSHAISQMRIFGLSFDIGIFTNLTHDHLDYHKSFKDYRDVKKIFFDTLPKSAFAITNVDDKNGDYMVQNTICKTITYSLKSNSDFSLKILEKDFNGMKLLINDIEFWTKLTGSFNAYNILTVFCVAKVFNISDELILKKISSLNSPEGRFELINSNSDKIGIIDYAHSPDSLKQVLKTINDLKNSNDSLITVVGCGGDRDKEKRPLMGKIACSLSDKVIFTSDNPRFEDPEIIINQMKNGVENKDKHKIILELNRKKAIQEACELANKSDIILIAGKGHEKYQIKGDQKIEFNDKKILIETLKINK